MNYKIWIFFLQNACIRLQEAFIHPPQPEPREARFITDARALFHVFWNVVKKHPRIAIVTLRGAKAIFNITPIGFV